jgi:hypothetical protein
LALRPWDGQIHRNAALILRGAEDLLEGNAILVDGHNLHSRQLLHRPINTVLGVALARDLTKLLLVLGIHLRDKFVPRWHRRWQVYPCQRIIAAKVSHFCLLRGNGRADVAADGTQHADTATSRHERSGRMQQEEEHAQSAHQTCRRAVMKVVVGVATDD